MQSNTGARAVTGAVPAFLLIDDVEVLKVRLPSWRIDGLFPSGALALLYGPPGCGKSTLAIAAAGSWVTGLPFLGRSIADVAPAVYVAGEGLGGYAARLLAWKVSRGIDGWIGLHVTGRAVPLFDRRLVAQFADCVQDVGAGFLVFDTWARCTVGIDENASGDVSRVIDNLDYLRHRTHAAILLVHHATKDGRTERGSSALRAAVDVVWALNEHRVLTCEKMRDGEVFDPILLALAPVADTGGCVIDLADRSAVKLSDQQARALRALQSFGADGAASVDWQRRARIPIRTLHEVKARLIGLGRVRKVGTQFVAIG